jgi:hypothetical protein
LAVNTFLSSVSYANGTVLPDWHSQYPSGTATYTESGYLSVIITANDTTEADVRPKDLFLPANPKDSDERWALVGKHSLAFSGPFTLDVHHAYGNNWSGVLNSEPFIAATLPSSVGASGSSNYSFHEEGRTLRLLIDLGGGAIRDAWFKKLPKHKCLFRQRIPDALCT